MKRTHALFATGLFVVIAVLIGTFWAYGQRTDQSVLNAVNNASAGAMQVQAVGRGLTSPNLTSNAVVQTLLNTWYDETCGCLKVYIDSSSGDIPFISTTALTNHDLLTYDSTGEEWVNTQGLISANISAPPQFTVSSATGTAQMVLDATNATNGSAVLDFKSDRASTGLVAANFRSYNNGGTPIVWFKFLRGASDTAGSLHILTSNSLALEVGEDQMVTQHAGQAVHRTDAGTADYNPSVLTGDYIIVADNSAAARAITISTEDVQSGSTDNPRTFIVKDEYGNAAAQNLTVSLESGNIDGAASQTISADYGAIQLYCDGTNCFTF